MSINLASVVTVPTLNGFSANQRVTGQDVEASPPQLYMGTIRSIWSDGSAVVKWDCNLNFEAERHLTRNGRVELHHLHRQS